MINSMDAIVAKSRLEGKHGMVMLFRGMKFQVEQGNLTKEEAISSMEGALNFQSALPENVKISMRKILEEVKVLV